jgi:transcriptional regulator with XRE-family HTH domain
MAAEAQTMRRRAGAGREAMPARSPNAADRAVARNVRFYRMARGLSQGELGDRLGLSFQQVQKIEKGLNRIGSGRLVRIAAILEVPLAALLDGVDGAEQSAAPSPLRLIEGRLPFRLARAFAAIKEPGMRRSLVALVEATAAACARRARARRA